jgi:hypothetical protein
VLYTSIHSFTRTRTNIQNWLSNISPKLDLHLVELCQKPPPIFCRPRARVHLENWRRTAGASHGNAIFKDDLRLTARHWDGWDGFSGWWLKNHLERYEFVSWDDYSQYMENKIHVPNHQPDKNWSSMSCGYMCFADTSNCYIYTSFVFRISCVWDCFGRGPCTCSLLMLP